MMTIRTNSLLDAPPLEQRRIFVIASKPVIERNRIVRHIVIFDDHPASLHLLLSPDLKPRRRTDVFYAVLAISSVLAAGFGMFWPML